MQSRKMSIVEQICNVGSGYLISLLVWAYIVVPYWNLEVTVHDNLTITAVFTIVSIVRGYLWRRLFNLFTNKGYV